VCEISGTVLTLQFGLCLGLDLVGKLVMALTGAAGCQSPYCFNK